MRQLIFVTTILLCFSCSKKQMFQQSDYKRVPGTRILVKIPDTYQYQRKGVYLISEKENIKFNYGVIGFSEWIAGCDKDKITPITHNGYEAYISNMSNPEEEQWVKMLVVNISGQALIAFAKINKGNTRTLEDIDKILSSVKYDASIELNDLDGLPFYIELENTGFQLTQTSFNSFRFTKDGKFEKGNKNVTNILISDKSPMDLENAEPFAKRIRDMAVRSGNLKCSEIEKTKIGKYDALIYESESDYKNIKRENFYAYLIDGDKTITFKGEAFEDFEKNKILFFKMIKSLVIN